MLTYVYPVGSIYMSVNNVSPQSFLGGTWQAWGAGKVPIGVDPNDTDFNAPNKSGGSKTVTLTVKNIPSHRHLIGQTYSGWKLSGSGNGPAGTYANFGQDTWSQYTGDGNAFGIMQPYITCYMWRRTS